MYYKLYIDSVFIQQMVMDLYLLSLAGQFLRRTATRRKKWLGAAMGAGISCLFLMMPVFTVGVRLLLSVLPVSMCMMCFVYGIYGIKRLLEASAAMGAAGFFFGSAMIWILNRFRTVMKGHGGLTLSLAAGTLVYWFLRGLLRRLMRRQKDSLRVVRFYVPSLEQEIRVKALVDTGNHLADPVTGAPVSLISRRMAHCMASCLRQEKYHVIPYHSVGRQSGILPAYELPEMRIEEAGSVLTREHVIIAVCDAGISEKSEYQMILHPGLLEN